MPRTQWPLRILLLLATFSTLAIATLALFPWGMLRGALEDRMSRTLQRPVTIGVLQRVDRISLHPIVEVRDLAIADAKWAGQGKAARIEHARVQFSALSLLLGRFQVESLEIRRGSLLLVRDRNGRKSWQGGEKAQHEARRPTIRHLIIRQLEIAYRDARQNRSADVIVRASPRSRPIWRFA